MTVAGEDEDVPGSIAALLAEIDDLRRLNEQLLDARWALHLKVRPHLQDTFLCPILDRLSDMVRELQLATVRSLESCRADLVRQAEVN